MRATTDFLATNVEYLLSKGNADIQTLADALGVSRQAVSSLISGKSKGLKPLNLVNAARFLGYSVEDLVCRDLRKPSAPEPQLGTRSAAELITWLLKLPAHYKPAEKGEIRAALERLSVDMQGNGRSAVKAARMVNLLYADV